MPTHRESTNAPIICRDVDEAISCAEAHHAQLVIAEDDIGIVSLVVDASKSGRWICMLCRAMSNATLREVVYAVWLRSNWSHHKDFRAWFVDAKFVPPPKEELLYGFGAPRLDKKDVPGMPDLPDERDDEHLPYLLVRSAVYLQYASNFDDEFRCRELITAVQGLELYRTEVAAVHVSRLQPHDLIDVFRLAAREDVMVALAQQATKSDSDRTYITEARDKDGRSALDIAIEKDFKEAAVLLRDVGCRSETFKFERLLDPAFQPMLKVLIDPWKPFPFDPVKSLQKVALGGQGAILRKLFHCRIDARFGFAEYPLAEACESGCDDVAWMVLDRMSATGVSPLNHAKCAAYHLVRSLMYGVGEKDVNGEKAPRGGMRGLPQRPEPGSTNDNDNLPSRRPSSRIPPPLSPTGTWVVHRLADVCLLEERRFGIPLAALRRGERDAELMPKLLRLIDVDQTEDTIGLLEFFVCFDPSNDLSRKLLRRALTDAGEGPEGVEERVYRLVWQMIQQGERALQMAHWGVELVCFRQYFPLTYRGDGGATILMKCGDLVPPNVGALESILQMTPSGWKRRVLDQPDLNGHSALKRLVLMLVQDPDAYGEHLPAYGDMVRIMLSHGFDFDVRPPEFPTDLFTMAARQDLGDVCYELLNTRRIRGSTILACSLNTLALMWRRHRRLQQHPRKPAALTSVFDEGEDKWRLVRQINKGTDTMEPTDSYVTNIVNVGVPVSDILTEEERREHQRFTAPLLEPSAEAVTHIDRRVEAARRRHPIYGDTILTLLDLDVLSRICSFVPLKYIRRVSLTSTSWFFASLFDEVWQHRQVTELFPNAKKQLTTIQRHAAAIAATNTASAGLLEEGSGNGGLGAVSPPPLDFVTSSHPLESSRSIFLMHASEHF